MSFCRIAIDADDFFATKKHIRFTIDHVVTPHNIRHRPLYVHVVRDSLILFILSPKMEQTKYEIKFISILKTFVLKWYAAAAAAKSAQ